MTDIEIARNTKLNKISGVARKLGINSSELELYGDYKAKIVDTRKTTPLFRAFEKYSVKIGGGSLHRFNLSDCAMIKDNHIKYYLLIRRHYYVR